MNNRVVYISVQFIKNVYITLRYLKKFIEKMDNNNL